MQIRSYLTKGLLGFLFFTFLFLINSQKAGATHYAAVDLEVKYIGTGPSDLTYQVKLYVYKACSAGSASLSPSETISWNSTGNCAPGGSQSAQGFPNGVGQDGDTLDQLCPGFSADNRCRNAASLYPGFIRKIYTYTVTLPTACTEWNFQWFGGNRNGAINNLCQPQNQLIRVIATINNVERYNASTPVFTNIPIPYFCTPAIPQLVQFQNGVLANPSTDSIEVTSQQPLGCADPCGDVTVCAPPPNDIIGWSPGFSLSQPIPSATPYTVNQFTGGAFFTPTTVGLYVLAFKATQYVKGTSTVVSSTRRDVQVAILNCASQSPVIDTTPINLNGATFTNINGQPKIKACAGQPLQFTVTASSQSASNSVKLNGGISSTPGATFSVIGQGTSNPIGSYVWTPNSSYIGGTYLLSFEAVDSTCSVSQPLLLKSYFNVLVEVLPSMDAGPDIRDYCANLNLGVQLNAFATQTANYKWFYLNGGAIPPSEINNPNIRNPIVKPLVNTSYIVVTDSIKSSACKSRDTVTVFIDNTNPVTIIPGSDIIQ